VALVAEIIELQTLEPLKSAEELDWECTVVVLAGRWVVLAAVAAAVVVVAAVVETVRLHLITILR